MKRLLVACECSGVVREAFRAVGWDAWSCDFAPTAQPGQHIQGNALDVLDQGWDMMIAHPPCTHLAVSGARYFTRKQYEQTRALEFVMSLMQCSIPLWCIENPVSVISTRVRKPDQIIQPWQFGHNASKSTCLWLNGLPRLVPTSILSKPECGYWDNQTPSGQNKLGPSSNRAAIRSKTYEGIAAGMAAQWGEL